jgi:spore germination cell wall hydrolase CwlJ-like protein
MSGIKLRIYRTERHRMKYTIAAILFSVVSASSMAAIKSPADIQILQYVTYREARGESVETIRAVLDVVNNRVAKNRETIRVTIFKAGQFPYIKRTGIRKVKDKSFLTKFWKAYIMKSILTSEALFFNHYKSKHKWADKHRRVGNLIFSREKEK